MTVRIGVIAPGNRLDTSTAEKVKAVAADHAVGQVEILFHDQCFLSSGHFAGDDDTRAAALLDHANDPAIDAIWFARGGYGAGRLLTRILPKLVGWQPSDARWPGWPTGTRRRWSRTWRRANRQRPSISRCSAT
jgi:muramoyltetrapeptide carboxypeptidase LdcA involved in peptidoglycan recycling